LGLAPLSTLIPYTTLFRSVVSAAPEEVIQSALEGIVPANHIFGTRFQYHPETAEIQSVLQLPAGYGKVAVVDQLRAKLPIGHNKDRKSTRLNSSHVAISYA